MSNALREMTTDQLRDWLAERDGWTCSTAGWFAREGANGWEYQIRATADDPVWHKGGSNAQRDLPHPDTLDGAAAAMPEGWTWTRSVFEDGQRRWVAQDGSGRRTQVVADLIDEKHARYLLAALCREASQ